MLNRIRGFLSGLDSKSKLLWAALLFCFIVYLPVNLYLFLIGVVELRLNDYGAYYNAAIRFLNGFPLYQTTTEISELEASRSGDMPYIYPPIFIFIFIPFTHFHFSLSGVLWDVFVLALLLFSVSRLIRSFDTEMDTMSKVMVFIFVASFGPTLTWIKSGQISGLLIAFLCLSLVALRSDHPYWSGVYTTLGSVVKPFYLTSGAHLLRSRKRLVSALLAGLVLSLLSIVIFGVDTNIQYIRVLQQGKGWETAIPPSEWHASHFNPFYILGAFKHLPRIFIVLFTIGISIYSNKNDAPVEYVFALGLAIIPLAAPTTNTLALNATIPAILITMLYELETTDSLSDILPLSALLIHIHPYSIEFLAKFGPQIFPQLEILSPIIPIVQPALYGSLLITGYLMYRVLKY